MRVRRAHLSRLLLFALLVALVVAIVGCGSGEQNTFAAEGDVARKQRDLLVYWVLGPAAVIFVGVQLALVYAVIRFRRRSERELPKQVHGNTRLELAWTIAPTILLLVIAVPTVEAIFDLGRAPADDALRVRVIGQQFLWQFEYPEIEDADGKPLSTIGELHVPVGREIAVTLTSIDVVHSFWVPRLAGKLDAIPGRENRMWFNATKPGSYSGQCAEFCGLQHADMRFIVMAESEEDFQAWVDEQVAGGGATGAGSGEPAAVGGQE